jgi:hypothetical protein
MGSEGAKTSLLSIINLLTLQETPYGFTGSTALRYRKSSPYYSCRTLSQLEDLAGKEAAMRRDDIMQTELVSEIVLLTSGILVIVTLIVAVMVAFARIASLLP